MMSVGCMQREVQIGRRRAEIFAQNLKNKPAPNRYRVTKTYNWPRALQTLLKDEPTCEPFFVGAEARPCRVWGLPAASTARGVGRGPATQLEVGRGRPLCRRQPTKHVVAPLQGCAAAHATRAARLTASSRRAVVRRLTACPAQYHAGRVVRPQAVFGMVGGCVDRHFPLWTVLLFFVCRRAETAVHVNGL